MVAAVDDRRIFERFPARFPAKFRHSRHDYGTNVFLRDASADGIRLMTKERLFLNDSVSLEVELPDGHDPLVLNGEVVWSRSATNDLWDVGLRFHKINLMQMRRMYSVVNNNP